MRIHLLSDLHLEFGKFPRGAYAPPDCDIVVLAGDVSTGVQGVMWAQETFGERPVIYVPGNHEFYGKRRYFRHIEKMHAKAEGSNVSVGTEHVFEVHGEGEAVRFLCCTLWTDFDLYGTAPISQPIAQAEMNDYSKIRYDETRLLTAEDTRMLHLRSRFFLNEALREPFAGKTVVVTHHAPSELSIDACYAGDTVNPAYASRLEGLILDHAPAAWMHGHVHHSLDYQIGETRILCNPRGYHGHALNPAFRPGLVIEV